MADVTDELLKLSPEDLQDLNAGDELPQIIVNNRFLDELSDEAFAALIARNHPEKLFTRGGELVRIAQVVEKTMTNHKKAIRPVIQMLNENSLRGYMARCAKFVRVKKAGEDGEAEFFPTSPPLDVVRDILSQDQPLLPVLSGIVQAPILRQDGSLFTQPGYDAITSLYYAPPSGFVMPAVPETPTTKDITKALNTLAETMIDFPFSDQASATNTFAAMLTPVIRDMIGGPVPLLLIDKPLQGTGATLLADCLAIVATGEEGHMTACPDGREAESEWRKRITAILSQGNLITVVDNLETTLKSGNLSNALTSTVWEDRILGKSKTVSFPSRTCWMVTGNNIRLAGDLPRRCFKIRLDANQAQPWQRDASKFRHPELKKYVKAHRGELLAAVYTLTRAWIQAGKPSPQNAPQMGSFESWRNVIGGILEFTGTSGFLGNSAEIYESAEINEGIEPMIALWYQMLGSEPCTAKKINRLIDLDPDDVWQEALPDWLDPRESGFTRKLGRLLARNAGVYFTNGYKLEKCGTASRAQLWKVVKVG